MDEEDLLEVDEETEEEPSALDEPDATEPEPAGEASLEEILASKPEERPRGEEDDEESILALGREERVETLSVKVIPQQPTEFTCRKCYLVKHRSQLADKKRVYCRDCA